MRTTKVVQKMIEELSMLLPVQASVKYGIHILSIVLQISVFP
jgi:hypothetical protein